MGRALLQVVVEMPDDLLQEFIQHCRDFDATHADCEMKILAKADDKTVEEMEAIFSAIHPPFNIREKFRKQ